MNKAYLPLVSVIIPTKNSSLTLGACLESIKNQTYKNIEIIVVDNNSTDTTKEIARAYTDKVFNQGPERSAQRNFGAKNAKGEYCVFIDSDMELSTQVIEECVGAFNANKDIAGVVIPEESFGKGFWAQCKKLERSFYVGVSWMEAARFFKTEGFKKVAGYDEGMVSGEDWDLSQRIGALGKISSVKGFIYHNEGRLSLLKTLKKKFYYAKKFSIYVSKHNVNLSNQVSILKRYSLFLSRPQKLFKNPVLGLGMLFMKTSEFVSGISGFLLKFNSVYLPKATPSLVTYPKISFVIPVYNAEKDIEMCLESVYKQNYPKDKIEVLVIDGGSTDSTTSKAQRFPVKTLKNDRKIAEYGKSIGIQASTGEFFVLLDSDNEIVETDWLVKMVKPIVEHPGIFGVESPLSYKKPLKILDRYFARMRIADPLAKLLASKPNLVVQHTGYKILNFKPNAILITGANGFLWNKKMVLGFNEWREKFEEANFGSFVHEQNNSGYAIPEDASVRHYYCESFGDYIKKRQKIALKVKQRIQNKEYLWVKKNSPIRIFVSVLYLGTFIGPFIESIYLNIRHRTFDYFFHSVISLITVWIYGLNFLKK